VRPKPLNFIATYQFSVVPLAGTGDIANSFGGLFANPIGDNGIPMEPIFSVTSVAYPDAAELVAMRPETKCPRHTPRAVATKWRSRSA
jgi:hypothetical protein